MLDLRNLNIKNVLSGKFRHKECITWEIQAWKMLDPKNLGIKIASWKFKHSNLGIKKCFVWKF
jgi:hypothetical protein